MESRLQPAERCAMEMGFRSFLDCAAAKVQPAKAGTSYIAYPPTSYSFEWVPSQNGIEAECLHAHQATVLASVISTFFGCKPVPA
jgi:hypothetical protein